MALGSTLHILMIATGLSMSAEANTGDTGLDATPAMHLGAPAADVTRAVAIPEPLGGGLITYDLDAAEQSLTRATLPNAPDWVVATRLLLGEAGPGRLTNNQYGLEEAVAILQTVKNRLDPSVWNPDGLRVRAWPGCGEEGTFTSCADPDQYLGLRNTRALAPTTSRASEATRHHALDVAVLAWWVVQTEAMGDVTDGAVSFVHRCGGAAYGKSTYHCDRRADVPDTPGAQPHTGPLLLRGPGEFDPRRGNYRLTETTRIDYAKGAPHLID